jgi:type I restriction enzyme M protein
VAAILRIRWPAWFGITGRLASDYARFDKEILYQSHIYKIRVTEDAPFDNYYLLAALSSPLVINQIRMLSFTQDIIDSIGDRINEIIIPVPKSEEHQRNITEMVKNAIESRIIARELTRKARQSIISLS